jgi:hypothetical protein
MKYLFLFLFLITSISYSQQRYELSELYSSVQLRIDIASKEIGITEENNPDRVYEYQKSVGISRHDPWCSAFQYYVSNQASKRLKQKNPYPNSAIANYLYNYAIKNGIKTKYNIQEGDYIIWKVANEVYGHIGLVVGVWQTGVITIEGNTGSNTIRTGGMVAKKFRSIINPIGRLKVRGLVGFKAQTNK